MGLASSPSSGGGQGKQPAPLDPQVSGGRSRVPRGAPESRGEQRGTPAPELPRVSGAAGRGGGLAEAKGKERGGWGNGRLP